MRVCEWEWCVYVLHRANRDIGLNPGINNRSTTCHPCPKTCRNGCAPSRARPRRRSGRSELRRVRAPPGLGSPRVGPPGPGPQRRPVQVPPGQCRVWRGRCWGLRAAGRSRGRRGIWGWCRPPALRLRRSSASAESPQTGPGCRCRRRRSAPRPPSPHLRHQRKRESAAFSVSNCCGPGVKSALHKMANSELLQKFDFLY